VADQTDRDALVERLCERMHDAYEAAAAVEGWSTQEASRKPWSEVPEANQRTMRASVTAALALLEVEGWGDVKTATEALDFRVELQADALHQLGHDTTGGIVPAARHRAVVAQLQARIARAKADHSRCRHHDDICSAIADANEAMAEALTAARAEMERLRSDLRTPPASGLRAVLEAAWGLMVEQQSGPPGWSQAKTWAFDDLRAAMDPYRTAEGDALDVDLLVGCQPGTVVYQISADDAVLEEAVRLRGLLAQACDEIDDLRGDPRPSVVADTLRHQGGITKKEETHG
jgi:hypothetical protein